VVTIKGSGFGSFIKTTEATQPKLGVEAFKRSQIELDENVSRTEVLFNNIGAIVVSWTDTEIKARVPHRHLFGIGKPGQFSADLSTGALVIRRGSWDLLPDGTCCTAKKWLTLEAGTFTIEAKGMPDQSFFQSRPEGATNDEQDDEPIPPRGLRLSGFLLQFSRSGRTTVESRFPKNGNGGHADEHLFPGCESGVGGGFRGNGAQDDGRRPEMEKTDQRHAGAADGGIFHRRQAGMAHWCQWHGPSYG
ncbi:MAG TPA: hypothetical protein VJR03_00570, partial [Nitrospira sp.]|nr:hypothetical protein [Nitrospira sp.]